MCVCVCACACECASHANRDGGLVKGPPGTPKVAQHIISKAPQKTSKMGPKWYFLAPRTQTGPHAAMTSPK